MSDDYKSLDDLPPIPADRRLIFQRELSAEINFGSIEELRPDQIHEPTLKKLTEKLDARPKLTVIRGGRDPDLLIEKVTENK